MNPHGVFLQHVTIKESGFYSIHGKPCTLMCCSSLLAVICDLKSSEKQFFPCLCDKKALWSYDAIFFQKNGTPVFTRKMKALCFKIIIESHDYEMVSFYIDWQGSFVGRCNTLAAISLVVRHAKLLESSYIAQKYFFKIIIYLISKNGGSTFTVKGMELPFVEMKTDSIDHEKQLKLNIDVVAFDGFVFCCKTPSAVMIVSLALACNNASMQKNNIILIMIWLLPS